jgi:hypothetical protein
MKLLIVLSLVAAFASPAIAHAKMDQTYNSSGVTKLCTENNTAEVPKIKADLKGTDLQQDGAANSADDSKNS